MLCHSKRTLCTHAIAATPQTVNANCKLAIVCHVIPRAAASWLYISQSERAHCQPRKAHLLLLLNIPPSAGQIDHQHCATETEKSNTHLKQNFERALRMLSTKFIVLVLLCTAGKTYAGYSDVFLDNAELGVYNDSVVFAKWDSWAKSGFVTMSCATKKCGKLTPVPTASLAGFDISNLWCTLHFPRTSGKTLAETFDLLVGLNKVNFFQPKIRNSKRHLVEIQLKPPAADFKFFIGRICFSQIGVYFIGVRKPMLDYDMAAQYLDNSIKDASGIHPQIVSTFFKHFRV